MDLDNYKCYICKILFPGDDVYECGNKHLVCENCFSKNGKVCECFEILSTKIPNPIIKELTKKSNPIRFCDYHEEGCTWKFNELDMIDHLIECKYRPFECIGKTLNVWNCKWKGQPTNLVEHFRQYHSEQTSFEWFQSAVVPFDEKNTIGTVNMINAFNKIFVFHYFSDSRTKMIYFLIYLIGRKEDAEHLTYEFVIKSPDEKHKMIKFVENCYSDVNALTLLPEGKCMVLTQQTVKNHIYEGNIHFRFVISKKDEKSDEKMSQSPTDEKKTFTPKKTVPKVGPINFKNKGTLRGNAGSSKNKSPTSPSPPVIYPKRSSEPQIPSSNSTIRHSDGHQATGDGRMYLSDGTAVNSPTMESPCLMPSIHRNVALEDQMRRDPRISYDRSVISNCSNENNTASNSRYAISQPYKMSDSKQYNQKYPDTCLSKPAFKK